MIRGTRHQLQHAFGLLDARKHELYKPKHQYGAARSPFARDALCDFYGQRPQSKKGVGTGWAVGGI